MQHLLRGSAIKKYKAVLTECKEQAKELAGDWWNLGKTTDITMDRLCNWAKKYGIESDGYA